MKITAVPVMAAAVTLFAARPLLNRAMHDPTPALVALFGALLVLGLAWPLTSQRPRDVVVVLALGLAAFAFGRLVSGHAPPAPTARVVLLASLAAVAEEAFFRRFVYAVLDIGGAALAVGGSTLLFALAHVTVYGWWVLPLDLAAGLVLSWQRWASGTWKVPAATHLVANLLVVL